MSVIVPSDDLKRAFVQGTATYVVKLYIRDDNFRWVDFSDSTEANGKNLLADYGTVGYVSERSSRQFSVRGTEVTLRNPSRFWYKAFPTDLTTVCGNTAVWTRSLTKTGRTSVKGRWARLTCLVEMPPTSVRSGALEELVLGTYRCGRIKGRFASEVVTLTLDSIASILRESSAEDVRDGMSWFENPQIGFCIRAALEQEPDFLRENSGSLPGSFVIPDVLRVATPDGGRVCSNYMRPPGWDGTTWNRKRYVSRAISVYQYNTGTVAFTKESKTVVGAGTSWADTMRVGDAIEVIDSSNGNDGFYEVLSVTDNTHCELKYLFTGVSESGLSYAFVRLYIGADDKVYEFVPGTEKWTEVSQSGSGLGAGYYVRHLWYNTQYEGLSGVNKKFIWGVAWSNPGTSDTAEPTVDMKIFYIDNQASANDRLYVVHKASDDASLGRVFPCDFSVRTARPSLTFSTMGAFTYQSRSGENIPSPFAQTIFKADGLSDTVAVSKNTEKENTLTRANSFFGEGGSDDWRVTLPDMPFATPAGYRSLFFNDYNSPQIRWSLGTRGIVLLNESYGNKGCIFYAHTDGVSNTVFRLSIYDLDSDSVTQLYGLTQGSGTADGSQTTYRVLPYSDEWPLIFTCACNKQSGSDTIVYLTANIHPYEDDSLSQPRLYEIELDEPVVSAGSGGLERFTITNDAVNDDSGGGGSLDRVRINDAAASGYNPREEDYVRVEQAVNGAITVDYRRIKTITDEGGGDWTIVFYENRPDVDFRNGLCFFLQKSWINPVDSDAVYWMVTILDMVYNPTAEVSKRLVISWLNRAAMIEADPDAHGVEPERFDKYSLGSLDVWTYGGALDDWALPGLSSGKNAYVGLVLGSAADGGSSRQDVYCCAVGTGRLYRIETASDGTAYKVLPVDDRTRIAGKDAYLASNLAIDSVSRGAVENGDIIYGISAPFWPNETQNAVLDGQYVLWKCDSYLTDVIDVGDFNKLSKWDVFGLFAEAVGAVTGIDEYGDFFFVQKHAPIQGHEDYLFYAGERPESSDVLAIPIQDGDIEDGEDAIVNDVAILPYAGELASPEAEIVLTSRGDDHYAPGVKSVPVVKFEVTQEDRQQKHITLVCVREGSVFHNNQVDRRPDSRHLRFKWLVTYPRILTTFAAAYTGGVDTTITVANVFGGDNETVGIHGNDWVVLTTASGGEEYRRILADGVDEDTNVLTIESAFTDTYSVGDRVFILRAPYRIEGAAESDRYLSGWSNEGVSSLAANIADMTVCIDIDLDNVEHLSKDTVVQIDLEEMLVVAVDKAASEIDVYDAFGTGNRVAIAATTKATHSSAAAVRGFFAPGVDGTATSETATDYRPDRPYRIGGTNVALRFVLPSGSNLYENEGVRGGRKIADNMWEEPKWTAEFIEGDRITISCAGLSMVRQKGSPVVRTDNASLLAHGKKPYEGDLDNRFLTLGMSIAVAHRIVQENKDPHNRFAIGAPLVPFLQPVYGRRMTAFGVQSEQDLPLLKDSKDVGYATEITHDLKAKATRLKIASTVAH